MAQEGQVPEALPPSGFGFIRIDPSESQSGMLFNLAAPAAAFQVIRMEGEAFTVRESVFDVIEKSPLMRTLNAVVVALGLAWYFRRLFKRTEERSGLGVMIAGLLLGVAVPARGQEALLRADDTGQALLRSRGDRCYAVTPAHVMGSETSALVTAPGRERGEGDLLRRIPAAPEPIALLSLRGIPLALCPAYEGIVALDALLRTRAGATLSLVRADGSIDRIPLVLSSIEAETLEVRTQTGVLEQGISGGTVLVADQPAGLLVDVMEEGRTGRVARFDRIFERLAPHLSSALPVSVLQAPAGSVPYEVLRSNASPVGPGNRVTSLLGDGPGPWRVPAGRVEVVLKLSAPVSGITLDLTGLDDPPGTVEVLGGRSERGPWQWLTSVTLEPGDTVQVRRFPVVNLSYLLLRAIAPATRPTLAINRVALLPK